jgi:hypothetical protein
MALPKFEDYKAPWETKDGKDVPEEEQQIDQAQLKKYLYGLQSDKERAQTARDEVTKERDELKTKADEAAREGETELDRIKRENAELKAAADKVPAVSREALIYKVALEKGLSADQATRLRGDTEEDLSADADVLLKSWGASGKEPEGEGDTPLVRTPRRTHNPGDPDPGGDEITDVAAAVSSINRDFLR